MASLADLVIKLIFDNKGLKSGLAEAGKSAEKAGQQVEEKLNGPTRKHTQAVKGLQKEYRLAVKEALQLASAFGATSKQAIDAQAKAGKLKDELGDVLARIDVLSADSGFAAITKGLHGVAGAASVITGAMALVGEEAKMTEQMILKVQAAMAITQGIEAIAGLKDAWTSLSIVVKANPMIAIGAALLAAGAAIYAYSTRLSETEKIQQDINSVNNTALKNAREEQVKSASLIAIARDETQSKETRLKAIRQLNEAYPKHLGNLRLETINSQSAAKAIEEHNQSLFKKARAIAAQERLIEIEKEIIDLSAKAAEGATAFEKIADAASKVWGFGNVKPRAQKDLEDRQKTAEKLQQTYLKYIKEGGEELVQMNEKGGKPIKSLAELFQIAEIKAKAFGWTVKELAQEKIKILNSEIERLADEHTPEAIAQIDGLKRKLSELTMVKQDPITIQSTTLSNSFFSTAIDRAEAKKTAEVLKELQKEFAEAEKLSLAFGASFNLNAEKQKLLEGAIRELIAGGLEPGSEAVQKLIMELNELVLASKKASEGIKVDAKNTKKAVTESYGAISNVIASHSQMIGESMAAIFTGAEVTAGGFFSSFLKLVAGFLREMGQAMIAAATFKMLFDAQLALNPPGALAAGIGLVAASAALNGIIAKGLGGGQSKGPSTDINFEGRSFAEGGIVYGRGIVEVAEYSNSRVDPEVISPLSKLRTMIADVAGGGTSVVVLETTVRGNDILLTSRRSQRINDRVR